MGDLFDIVNKQLVCEKGFHQACEGKVKTIMMKY